jgi:hypothetical protein
MMLVEICHEKHVVVPRVCPGMLLPKNFWSFWSSVCLADSSVPDLLLSQQSSFGEDAEQRDCLFRPLLCPFSKQWFERVAAEGDTPADRSMQLYSTAGAPLDAENTTTIQMEMLGAGPLASLIRYVVAPRALRIRLAVV